MKEGWEYKKLGEVCVSDLGKTLNQSKDTGTYRPYLCAVNIQWDDIDLSTLKQSRFEDNEIDRYSVRKGDLLVCEGGDIGRAAIWNNEETILYQNALHRIRFNDNVQPRFCLQYLRSLKQNGILDSRYAKGVTIKHLVKSSLLSIPIPIPPISEQQRIVEELDLLSSIIEKKKEQLKELDNLAQSIFYDMFGDPVVNEKGWPTKTLGELSEKIANGYNAKLEEDTYKSEGIMYFRCQNVWRNRFDYSDLVYIDEETNKKMKSSSLKHNDFLVTKIGRVNTENSSLGRISLYEGDDDKANLSGNLCFIRLKKDVLVHKYLLYIFVSDQFRDYIRRTTVGGIDKRALNTKQLSTFPVHIPPLSLQQQFAEKIEAIEKQKEQIKQSIAEMETLFNSRMDYYFT